MGVEGAAAALTATPMSAEGCVGGAPIAGAAEAGGLGHRVPADRRPPLAPPESGRKATPPRSGPSSRRA